MSILDTIFEVIDMRSFSNLWYWIGLAVLWSTTSYWVLGVPFDMITRARRQGGEAAEDLADIVRVNVNRILYIARVAGVALTAAVAFGLTTLGVLAFYYDVEFAQALFCLVFPMSIVGAMSIATAQRIAEEGLEPEVLYRRLMRHRLWTQVIGMASIFVTALYGMYQNLDVSPAF